jgi:hypothetical protein
MRLRLVAGTDVGPAAATPPAGVDLAPLLEPLYELFERHKEAQTNYKHAVADVARQAGRKVTSVGHTLAAEYLRRKRAAEQPSPDDEPFEPDDWCILM